MLAMLVPLLVHCRGERAESRPSTASSAPPPVATTRKPVTIQANGAEFATIAENAGVVEIQYAGHTLRGEMRDSGKRKYTRDGGSVMYEIKPAEEGDGFKLRLFDGALRWKVKVTPEKIKISDNEDNDKAFELKPRAGDRTKVFAPEGVELGNIRGSDVENAAGKTLFTIAGDQPSGAFGVLLMERIPQEEKLILIAELRTRNR